MKEFSWEHCSSEIRLTFLRQLKALPFTWFFHLLSHAPNLIKTWCCSLFHTWWAFEKFSEWFKLTRLLCMHETKFLKFHETQKKRDWGSPSIANVLWFIFHAGNSIFSLTHDLSHEILYAFGSVIKLICHFFSIILVGKNKETKPQRRRSSSWWIVRVTSSLFKWNLKGLVKKITTIFHRTSLVDETFCWFLISFCFCRHKWNQPWMANAKCHTHFDNFSHSWFSEGCFGQAKLITGL